MPVKLSEILNENGIIAGPCSAESRSQLFKTTEGLVAQGINIIRAGIWKPRTRPNSFEGLGETALPWLRELKEKYPVKTATEVASSQHVALALQHDVNILWVGARTTVSPFLIEEISESLAGSDIPVMIKNPINADESLWIGAIERFLKKGINNIGLIHRGFSTYKSARYRNLPHWQIALDVKSAFPELPMVCDPSHIGGKKQYLREIAQKAYDLNFDGLMIETHCNPDLALSDKEQQITPEELKELLRSLKKRSTSSEDSSYTAHLEELRDKIDHLDHQIIESIISRLQLVDAIGLYKKKNNVSIFQLERLNEILKSRKEWSNPHGVPSDFVEELFKLIHHYSVKRQNNIFKSTK